MALESNERPDQSIAKFESMLKTDDVYFFDAEDFEDIIHHYLNNGKITLAKKAIRIGLQQHPGSIELKLLDVEVLVFENHLDQAEQYLDELQLLDSSNEEIFIQRANIFSKKDKITGNPLKINFGSWIMILFKFISLFKFLRGTYFDLFGYFEERKIERLLINNYKDRILEICSKLTIENYALAVEIASTPDQIRGFGYIKEKNIEIAKRCEDKLMSAFNG